jgi:UDP-N-acetylmuramoyl-tripeptide--D-alanyl-D-alanine ligase
VTLSAAEIASACAGTLVQGDPARLVSRVSIDSRTLTAGDVFFAIRGARLDGHVFVAAALASAAAGVVVDARAERPEAGAAFVIVVDDTTRALQRLARQVRRALGVKVVAITGSVGKTTTKEIAATLLSTRHRTFRNRGNLNNHIGLPLSLLEMERGVEVAVVELGMSGPGEIRTLIETSEPEVRVWTNVGPAHLAFFPSVDAIADAKAEIAEGAGPETELVANATDPRVMARVANFPGRLVTFAVDAPADVMATDVRDRGLQGMEATLTIRRRTRPLTTTLLGRGNLANILAATAVADRFGVALDEIVERVRVLEPVPHRGNVFTSAAGALVVDDSYNSSPLGLERALRTIGAEPNAKRRVAVLGEMLELGERSAELHAECGRVAVEAGISRLFTVGGAPARALGEAAVAAGLASDAVTHAEDSGEAAEVVAQEIEAGDVVLIKGSRGTRLEAVVERLQGPNEAA